MPFGRVAYLDGDGLAHGGHNAVQTVEVADEEVLAVGCLRVVAVAHIEDVGFDVLLHHKPRAAAQAKTLALADGVKPMALVSTYLLSRFQLYHVARQLA